MCISQADISSRQLVFNWSPVAPDCPAIHYNILTSNCGSCPTTTTHTTAICTDVPIDGSVCMFALQTVVCGKIVGNSSETIEGMLKGLHILLLWKVTDCSLVDNLIAKKLILPTFRLDALVLFRARGLKHPVETLAR